MRLAMSATNTVGKSESNTVLVLVFSCDKTNALKTHFRNHHLMTSWCSDFCLCCFLSLCDYQLCEVGMPQLENGDLMYFCAPTRF